MNPAVRLVARHHYGITRHAQTCVLPTQDIAMALLKLLTAGALGYVAYRALQSRNRKPHATLDHGTRTTPHGDPVLVGTTLDVPPAPSAGAQSSRGFSAP